MTASPEAVAPDVVAPEAVALDAGTVREIRAVVGLDVSELPAPGRAVVVAGIGGTGVSSVVRAVTRLAPHLEIGEWDPDGTGDVGPAVAILVVDPSSAVAAEESALLATLRREAGVVAVVCNKIDAYWEWPATLRRIRAVLDPAGRLSLFAVAATCGDTGMAALTGWLTTVTTAPAGMRRRLRQAGVAMAAADDAARTGPPGDDPARLRELGEQRRRRVAGRDRGRAERHAAARIEFAAARADVIEELGTTLRTLAATAAERCDRLGRHEAADHRRWLDTQLGSAAGHLDRTAVSRLREAAAVSLAGIGPAPEVTAGAGQVVPTAPMTGAAPRRGAEDALFALLGVSTGFGLGRAVAAAASSMGTGHTVGWMLTPLTVMIGLAIALWVIGVRRTSATRTQVRSVTAAAITELRTGCERLLAARSSAAELEVSGQIARHHDRLLRDTVRRVAAIDAELGWLRSPGADPARPRAARALADRLAILADPESRTVSTTVSPTDPPVPSAPGTDDDKGR